MKAKAEAEGSNLVRLRPGRLLRAAWFFFPHFANPIQLTRRLWFHDYLVSTMLAFRGNHRVGSLSDAITVKIGSRRSPRPGGLVYVTPLLDRRLGDRNTLKE